jgi:tetratricopeptide (TPR) repeat protein
MTSQWARSRTLLLAGIGLVLVAAIVAATSVYRIEQRLQVGDVHGLIDEGIAQFRDEQYELSLQTLGGIPEDMVDDWHIPYYMGSALIKLKDYEQAALQLERALALNNSDTNILFALGVVYYKLGNLSLSKAYFASVLKIDPSHEEAKGLMDIMASLERNQPGATKEETPRDNDAKAESH